MLDDFNISQYNGGLGSIVDVLEPIKEYYPDYAEWLESNVQSGLINHTRTIKVLKNDNKIAGLTILKDTTDEKKICTLFVHPEYRGEAWMYALFMDAIRYLKTDKPVITIPSMTLTRYYGLIFSNGWINTSKVDSRYTKGIVEYGFNEV